MAVFTGGCHCGNVRVQATAMDYDGEGEDDRTARWAARWTPATVSAKMSPGPS